MILFGRNTTILVCYIIDEGVIVPDIPTHSPISAYPNVPISIFSDGIYIIIDQTVRLVIVMFKGYNSFSERIKLIKSLVGANPHQPLAIFK
jgi:hypothetical protein